MSLKNISYLPQKFFLFICLLYGLIPTEGAPYITDQQFHWIFLLLIIIYTLYINSFKINIYGVIFFMLFVLFAGLNSFITMGHDIVLFSQAVLFAAVIAPTVYTNDIFRNQFLIALRWLLILSLSMFYLQFTIYHVTGNLLLVHEFFFPFSHARLGSEGDIYDNIVRMGGMYIEPGTYSNFIYVYMLIYMVITKNLKDPLLYFIAVSIILTYSAWGMMVASYFLIILIFSNLKQFSLIKRILLFLIIFFLGFSSIKYFENTPAVNFLYDKLHATNGSTGHKKDAYKEFYRRSDNLIFTGEGFQPTFKHKITSLQDSGILLNFAIIFGALFALLIFVVFIISLLKATNIMITLISLPVFFDKMYYWDGAFMLLFFIVLYQGLFYKKRIRI